MSQSLFDTTELRLQVCTDDPCCVMRGTAAYCDRMAATLVLFWLVLGWDLSYHKAQLGATVGWVGYSITIQEDEVVAEIKAEFMDELKALTQNILSRPRISMDELRSYAGKANHVANLVYYWRPFFGPVMGGTQWVKIVGGIS